MITWEYQLSHCNLKLEDVPDLHVSNEHASVFFLLRLSSGEVVYNGGPIRFQGGFIFQNCAFDLETNGVPEGSAKALLTAGLNSNDLIELRTSEGQGAPQQPSGE